MGSINKEDMQVAVENFVLSVFASADKDERTCETVGKPQAVAFKRAGDFIMILSLFGEMSPEWQERRKYCVYKAGTIMKGLKTGEMPPRGNPFAPPEEETKEPVAPVEQLPTEQPGMPQPVVDTNMPSPLLVNNQSADSAGQVSPMDAGQNPYQQPAYQPQQPAY